MLENREGEAPAEPMCDSTPAARRETPRCARYRPPQNERRLPGAIGEVRFYLLTRVLTHPAGGMEHRQQRAERELRER